MKIVGFKIYSDWMEFGYSETLYSFFSTVCYNLENKEWGSRFPIIMNSLYYDEEFGVKYEDIEEFQKEIKIIQDEFSKLKPKNAIWSFEDEIFQIPKNKPNIDYDAKSLESFYQNNFSKNIFDLFQIVLEDMSYYKSNCKIEIEKN